MNYNLKEINKVNENTISDITKIILFSNKTSLIAKLGESFVKKFLVLCIHSKNVKIFTLNSNNLNLAYAIFFNKEKLIIKELLKLKFTIFFTIIYKFKFDLLYSILLIYLKRDVALISDKNKINIGNSVNLTYLAVNHKHQNQGIGRIFLEDILKKHFRNEFISVETDNRKTLNFYTKYLNFEIIGSRKRYKNDLYLLLKKNK